MTARIVLLRLIYDAPSPTNNGLSIRETQARFRHGQLDHLEHRPRHQLHHHRLLRRQIHHPAGRVKAGTSGGAASVVQDSQNFTDRLESLIAYSAPDGWKIVIWSLMPYRADHEPQAKVCGCLPSLWSHALMDHIAASMCRGSIPTRRSVSFCARLCRSPASWETLHTD